MGELHVGARTTPGISALLLAVTLSGALVACSRATQEPVSQAQAEPVPSASPSTAASASVSAPPVEPPAAESPSPTPEPTLEATPRATTEPASEPATTADDAPPDNDPVTLKYWPGLKDIPSCRQSIRTPACAVDALHLGVPHPASDAAKIPAPRPAPSIPAGCTARPATAADFPGTSVPWEANLIVTCG